MTVFMREPDLNGLCFNAVMVCGGCTNTVCEYCSRAGKLLFARDKARCVSAALRVTTAKADDGGKDRDRSRSRDRDGGRSSSRDRDARPGAGRGQSPGRGQ